MDALNLNSNPKQPEPQIMSNSSEGATQKRKINKPQVGVVDVPHISSTPLSDTISLKKQENPRMKYKLTPKSNNGFISNNIISVSVLGCGLIAILSEIGKIKKHFKK